MFFWSRQNVDQSGSFLVYVSYRAMALVSYIYFNSLYISHKKIDDFTMDLTTLFGERKIYFPADYLGYRNIRSRDENGVVHFLLLDFLVSCDILSVK